MSPRTKRIGLAAMLLPALACTAADELRTWIDSTGEHRVEAELVAVEGDSVRLRNADGKEVTTPLARLSAADRAYARQQATAGPSATDDSPGSAEELTDYAERFFADLRTKSRKDAASLLTKASRALVSEGKSPLAALPSPDDHARAIRVGEPAIDSGVAKTPVLVRVGKQRVRTTLHFNREDDAWRIAAISAELPNRERTILFDKATETPKEKKVDPLLALMDKPLPIEGRTLDGRNFSSDAYRGKVVLVDFWATWCGPCRAEIPNIRANYDAYHAKGFEVVAVSTDKDLDALAEFVEAEQPPWVVVADKHPKTKETMGRRYGIRYLPSVVLVGRDGKVVAVNCRGKRLGAELKKLLGKPLPATVASLR